MKATFNRNVDCDYHDRRMNETYPKYYRRYDNLQVEAVEDDGRVVHLALYNGDTIMNVPKSAVSIH